MIVRTVLNTIEPSNKFCQSHSSVGSVPDSRTGGHGSIPILAKSSTFQGKYCYRIHSSLPAVDRFDKGYVTKHQSLRKNIVRSNE